MFDSSPSKRVGWCLGRKSTLLPVDYCTASGSERRHRLNTTVLPSLMFWLRFCTMRDDRTFTRCVGMKPPWINITEMVTKVKLWSVQFQERYMLE